MTRKTGPYSSAWSRFRAIRAAMELVLMAGWLLPVVLWRYSEGLGMIALVLVIAIGYGLFVQAVAYPCPRCGKELGPMRPKRTPVFWRITGEPILRKWQCPNSGIRVGEAGT